MFDADAHAATLRPGSIDRMHRRLVKAVAGFLRENGTEDTGTAMAIVTTHMLDLLLVTAQEFGGAKQPGSFQRYMASVSGAIERGEHRLGARQ